jgi:phage terminase large subunit-like protein
MISSSMSTTRRWSVGLASRPPTMRTIRVRHHLDDGQDDRLTIESTSNTIVGINQGWKLSGAIKTAERKLADRTLVHGGQALMAWAVGNARVKPKGNAIVITKQASGTAKIDPLMAAFNAVAWMSANPATSQPSIFVI